ncbi:MAG: hypothetical protein WCK34_10305 [Bacteroidota bacterium]
MGRIASMLLLLVFPFFGCREDKGILCTQEYRFLVISIKNSASLPVLLTRYYVQKTGTGETLEFPDSTGRVHGKYCLITDSQMSMTIKTGSEFIFHGLVDTNEVVREKYLVGNDGCHINLIAGKTEIVILK